VHQTRSLPLRSIRFITRARALTCWEGGGGGYSWEWAGFRLRDVNARCCAEWGPGSVVRVSKFGRTGESADQCDALAKMHRKPAHDRQAICRCAPQPSACFHSVPAWCAF